MVEKREVPPGPRPPAAVHRARRGSTSRSHRATGMAVPVAPRSVPPTPGERDLSGWPRDPTDLIDLPDPVPRGLGRGDEDVATGKLLEQRRRLAEVGGQHIVRVARDP